MSKALFMVLEVNILFREQKHKTQTGIKYLHITYPTKDLYLEQIKKISQLRSKKNITMKNG